MMSVLSTKVDFLCSKVFTWYLPFAFQGYYGEGVPYDSGMTLAVKSHGFTTGNFSLRAVSPTTSEVERRQHNHIKELNSTAIVLIRNPFRAIIGHRHLDEGGHTGHAKEESFLGPGKFSNPAAKCIL